MVINSISAGVSVAMASIVFRQSVSLDFFAILIVGIIFVVIYLLQDYYAKRIFLQAEKKAKQRHSVALFDSQDTIIK